MYGLFGGINYADQTEIYSSYEVQSGTNKIVNPGILEGIEIGYYNRNDLSLSIKFFINQKRETGSASVFALGGFLYGITYKMTIDYLEIPIAIRIPLFGDNWQSYIFGGPSIGIFLDGFGEQSNPVVNGKSDVDNSGVDNTGINFALYGGIGLNHHISSNMDFFMEAGYADGLNTLPPFLNVLHSLEYRIYFGILFGKE